MRVVVFHDVFSGLALRPAWGAMYGPSPVSEQALAEEGLERLPADAVVLADGNFGIFAFAYAVQQSQRPMILRLTQARTQKILGSKLVEGTDQRVVWRPSQWDRKAHPRLPAEASLEGRLLVCANPSRPDELLYCFRCWIWLSRRSWESTSCAGEWKRPPRLQRSVDEGLRTVLQL